MLSYVALRYATLCYTMHYFPLRCLGIMLSYVLRYVISSYSMLRNGTYGVTLRYAHSMLCYDTPRYVMICVASPYVIKGVTLRYLYNRFTAVEHTIGTITREGILSYMRWYISKVK